MHPPKTDRKYISNRSRLALPRAGASQPIRLLLGLSCQLIIGMPPAPGPGSGGGSVAVFVWVMIPMMIPRMMSNTLCS
jgi:hypothetical protein